LLGGDWLFTELDENHGFEEKIYVRMLFTLGHMLLNKTNTQLPPILAWTPYQIQAIAPRLKVHHRLPQIPKLVRATTGKVTWKIAPTRF
jgi:hypothetical protein